MSNKVRLTATQHKCIMAFLCSTHTILSILTILAVKVSIQHSGGEGNVLLGQPMTLVDMDTSRHVTRSVFTDHDVTTCHRMNGTFMLRYNATARGQSVRKVVLYFSDPLLRLHMTIGDNTCASGMVRNVTPAANVYSCHTTHHGRLRILMRTGSYETGLCEVQAYLYGSQELSTDMPMDTAVVVAPIFFVVIVLMFAFAATFFAIQRHKNNDDNVERGASSPPSAEFPKPDDVTNETQDTSDSGTDTYSSGIID